MSEHTIRVFGGVLDGGDAIVPSGATPGFQRQIRNNSQTTDYTLREHHGTETLVADGMRWPILEETPA